MTNHKYRSKLGQDEPGTLNKLIQEMNWTKLRTAVHQFQEELKEVDQIRGWTTLHYLCAVPAVPNDIFKDVVELYPEAIKVKGKKWGQMPLHILCWNSQGKSVRKVEMLLKHMSPEDVLTETHFGGSALHCACASNAWLPVMERLIEANEKVVLVKTREYKQTALVSLWLSHLQTIQGHMHVAKILRGEEVQESDHFDKFWSKVLLMATTAFKLSPAYFSEAEADIEKYVLHGLQYLRAPLRIQQVAIKLHPEWASVAGADGNYPLHNVIIRRPFRIRDIDIIKDLVSAYPEAASKRNSNGKEPIFIALHERIAWDDGVEALVKAQPNILSSIDNQTRLYPFLLAASLGGKVAIETTYQLLCANPHLAKI